MSNNSELEKIFTYVQKLEKRISELESKEAIIINTNPLDNQIKPLNLSLDKLIDIYNDIPQLLIEYGKRVSLQAESYRSPDKNNLIVEQTTRGKYLVILIENNLNKKYYLIPNFSSKLKIHRLKSLTLLFTIQGNRDKISPKLNLITPTELEILPSGKQWQVNKQGKLSVEEDSPLVKVMSELEKVIYEEKQTPESIEKLLNILQQINQRNSQLNEQIKILDDRIKKLEPDYCQLINLYYQNPQEFSQLNSDTDKLQLSNNTENSILQGKSIKVYLEANKYGEYLAKKGEDCHYLFPNPLEIFDKTTLTLTILSKLFTTESKIPVATLGTNIKIIKPAKIRLVEDSWENDLWELLSAGEISF